jgi:phosphate/sulfate permease
MFINLLIALAIVSAVGGIFFACEVADGFFEWIFASWVGTLMTAIIIAVIIAFLALIVLTFQFLGTLGQQ